MQQFLKFETQGRANGKIELIKASVVCAYETLKVGWRFVHSSTCQEFQFTKVIFQPADTKVKAHIAPK